MTIALLVQLVIALVILAVCFYLTDVYVRRISAPIANVIAVLLALVGALYLLRTFSIL